MADDQDETEGGAGGAGGSAGPSGAPKDAAAAVGDGRAGSRSRLDPPSEAGPAAPARVDAALLRQVIEMQPFTRWTGLELIRAEDGEVETRLVPRSEDMTQHHGFVHGGLIGFLADNAAAYAAATLVGDVLTAQYSINFVSPGVGEALVTRAKVIKAGKRQIAVEARVFAINEGEEKLVATAQATILPATAPAQPSAP